MNKLQQDFPWSIIIIFIIIIIIILIIIVVIIRIPSQDALILI